MVKSIASSVLLATLVLTSPGSAQQPGPWFGTWKLNFAKSNGFPPDRFKKVITRIEPAGDGLKVIYDVTGTRGGVTHMEWLGKFDGQDRPLQGNDSVLTHAYSRIDDHSYQILVKRDGLPATTVHVTVSADGRTLTTVTTDTQSKNVTTSVYDKE